MQGYQSPISKAQKDRIKLRDMLSFPLNAEFLFSIYAGCVAGPKVGINKEKKS
jgi:hypothetical protein